jgi:hypothetical protein
MISEAFRKSYLVNFLFVSQCYLTIQKASITKMKGAMVDTFSASEIRKSSKDPA